MQVGVETSRAVENKRLFVVDDDEITRAALQFMLHDENETHEVPDMATALRKSAQQPPDVILLALSIVQQHGIALLQTVKAQLPKVKLLLVAPTRDDPLVTQCLQQGADALLCKPLTVENTRKQVDRLLGRINRTVIPIHSI